MQRDKTIEFWNDYHEKDPDQEWILNPSESILNLLLEYILEKQDATAVIKVLEIGCGTSTLGRDLFLQATDSRHLLPTLDFIVTDVSPICVAQNKQRDKDMMLMTTGRHSFEYRVLNALDPKQQNEKDSDCQDDSNIAVPLAIPDNKQQNYYNIILDKGCMDTFLFRSQKREQEGLMTRLLNNVYSWLATDAKFIVMTPRSKQKFLRDFRGFSAVQRRIVKHDVGRLDDGNKKKSKQEQMYMYICTKNPNYVVNNTDAFRHRGNVDDDSERDPDSNITCQHCGMSFDEFASGKVKYSTIIKSTTKQAANWRRTWNGHRTHCRPHKN